MNDSLRGALPFLTGLVRPREGAATAAIALAMLAPLAVLPSAMNPYNFPKMLVMALAIGVGVYAQRRGALPRAVLVTMAVGALVFVAAAFAAAGSPIPGLVGRWPRYEGLPTLAVYAGSAWLGARLLTDPPVARVQSLHVWAAVSASLLGAFSTLDALGLSPLGWTSAERTGSLLGNATDQGLLAVLLAGLMLAPALRLRSPLLLVGLASAVLTIALSGSRTALLVTLLLVALHLVRLGRSAARALVVVGVGMVAGTVLLPQARDRLLNGATFESRVLAWQETLHLSADHWWLGVGPSSYSDAIGRYQDPEWVAVVGAAAKPDSPHSWPLQALAAGGVPLLLAALMLAGLVVHIGWRRVRTAAALAASRPDNSQAVHHAELALGLFASVTAYGVALLLNFTTPSTTCLAAFLTGALIGVPYKAQERVRERARERIMAVGIAALGVLLLATASLTEVALRSGAELAAAGRTQLAVERFALVERLRPMDKDARMLSAQYLAEQASRGDLGAARAAARRARESLRATPDSYESNVALGVALIALGKLKPSLLVLDDAVVDYPFRAPAYLQRGIARVRLGDIAGGAKDLQRAAALRPDDPAPVRLLLDLRARLVDSPLAEGSATVPARLPKPSVRVDGRRAVLRWDPPASDGGSSITSYRGILNGKPFVVAGSRTTLTGRGLAPGDYAVRVAAVNGVGAGPLSPAREFTIVPAK